jgi:putative DNA primase/helicase
MNGEIRDFIAKEKTQRSTERAADGGLPAFSDEALALRFAEQHQHDLRYVAAWGKWLRWDGAHWCFDSTLHAFDRAREICREAAEHRNKPHIRAMLASAKTVAAIERLAKADRRTAATADQWDVDPWLLNTPDGIIDLKSGQLRSHLPEDYLTKITSVGPNASCPTPLWLKFLAHITGSDIDLIAFLRRMLGYAMTGITNEHAMFFAHGTGGNGKGTLVGAVAGILGDYHTAAPIETFTDTKVERHPTELAGLRGARLVTATETEEGRRWAESRIKELTGGDKISARFMRQDFFEYVPQFKLLISGNHKPGLRSVDEAIRRRFNLVPFNVTIPTDKRDKNFAERLKPEWPGILHWMVQGCLDWQRRGLAPPKAVQDATAAYLEAEDASVAWIDECCERDPEAWESSMDLFASFKAWAERAGEYGGSRKRFAQVLEGHGLVLHRHKLARGYRGLKLRGVEPTPW